MRDWTGPNWEAGRLLAFEMIRPKGEVSVFSRLSGELIDNVILARDEPGVVLGRVGELVSKWIDAPVHGLNLRRLDYKGSAGRRALRVGIVGTHSVSGSLLVRISLTEAPSIGERWKRMVGRVRGSA